MNMSNVDIDVAKHVFDTEIEGLITIRNQLDSNFIKMVDYIDSCKGHVVFMGVGKSGHICKKIVATMQSLGIKALYIHPTEGLHGDLGCISDDDLVVYVSNSGETEELLNTIISIKYIGATTVCIVGRKECTLMKECECGIVMCGLKEAYLGMVPTTTTTSTLVIGDALAVAIATRRDFTKSKFGIYHPHGTLGKRLTMTIDDFLIVENSSINVDSTVKDAIMCMCKTSLGGVSIIDKDRHLVGVFTDGDLRRLLGSSIHEPLSLKISDIMTKNPITMSSGHLAFDEIEKVMRKHQVSFYPVVKDNIYIGSVNNSSFIKSGLI